MKKYALVFFFFLAYAFTWSNWLPQALSSRGIASIQVPDFLTLISGYGPALAAIIVVSLAFGRQGLRNLFGRLLRWRAGIQWYFIALFLPAIVIFLAISLQFVARAKKPKKAPEPTPTSVTSPAAQQPRQP